MNFLDLINRIYKKPTAKGLNGGKLNASSPRSEIRLGCPLVPLLFNTVLEVLAKAVRQ